MLATGELFFFEDNAPQHSANELARAAAELQDRAEVGCSGRLQTLARADAN